MQHLLPLYSRLSNQLAWRMAYKPISCLLLNVVIPQLLQGCRLDNSLMPLDLVCEQICTWVLDCNLLLLWLFLDS